MRLNAFAPTFLLALVFIASKAMLAWPYLKSRKDPSWLIGASAQDLLAALVFGAMAALALRFTARRPRLHRAAWVWVILVAAAAAIYSVANIGVVRTLGYPLNARMFSLVNRVGDLRSSIAAHCSVAMAIGMVVCLIVFPMLGHRRLRFAPARGTVVILLAISAGWIGYGMVIDARAEPDSWFRRVGKNPHGELLVSIASRALLNRRVEIVEQFPAEYLNDFNRAVDFQRPALAPPSPRNVIVIVMESTSAQYLSLYGAPFDTTPNLIKESKNALVFDRFYANVGYTYRSVVPLIYGVYPGLPWKYRTDVAGPVTPGMAAVLRSRGYRTAFLAAANPEWGGMDWICKEAGMEEIIGPEQLDGPAASSWGTEDGALIDGVIRWIDAGDRSRPFYAVAWTDQTHDPYTLAKDVQPIRFVDEANVHHGDLENRYLNAIRQGDHHIGRLFDALRARNLADDTLVVITGDHGEAFGQAHEVVSHGSGLFDECQRVPMMFWNPRLWGGQRSGRVGAHVDINATIAHILGIDPPREWQGASLLSPQHPGRAYMLVDLSGYQFAVADERFKYVLHYTDGFGRLYDLKADPLEQRDVSGEHAEVTAAMRGRVSAFVRAEERYLASPRAR
jgi:lipoteichoic acid synthase